MSAAAQGEGVMSGMDKTQLLGMTPDELTVYFKQLGQPCLPRQAGVCVAASGRGL